MDLRIQNGNVDPASSLPNSRTDPLAPSSGRGLDSLRISSGDSVSISDLSTRIADALCSAEAASSSRVSRLAALYASGSYHVDAAGLSRSIVDRALQGEGL